MKTREATPEEVTAEFSRPIHKGRMITYRHFAREIPMPHAEHGAAIRTHGRSKIHWIDGVPHVRCHGRLQELTATRIDLESGSTLIADPRIKSEYLK